MRIFFSLRGSAFWVRLGGLGWIRLDRRLGWVRVSIGGLGDLGLVRFSVRGIRVLEDVR